MSLSNSSPLQVLTLFLIPIGGGIPAGVILARSRNIEWPMMMLLYFISDVILACVFEPILRLIISLGKKSPHFDRMKDGVKKWLAKSTAHYGTSLGPFALIMVSLGVDPMTGRAATVAAGHGFISGWMLAIMGDMIYFTILMVSTLWLNGILGDGTLTTMIILVAMMIVPILIRRFRKRNSI